MGAAVLTQDDGGAHGGQGPLAGLQLVDGVQAKACFADRAAYMADTAFAEVPLDGLTSKDYAKTIYEKITDGSQDWTAVVVDDVGDDLGHGGPDAQAAGGTNGHEGAAVLTQDDGGAHGGQGPRDGKALGF